MSFEYMKNLRIDTKKGILKATFYSNNLRPYMYSKYEFNENSPEAKEKNKTLLDEISGLIADIIDGNIHPTTNSHKINYIMTEIKKTQYAKDFKALRWDDKRPYEEKKQNIKICEAAMLEEFLKLWNAPEDNKKYFLYNANSRYGIIPEGIKIRATRYGMTYRTGDPKPLTFYEAENIINQLNGVEWRSRYGGTYTTNYQKIECDKIKETI